MLRVSVRGLLCLIYSGTDHVISVVFAAKMHVSVSLACALLLGRILLRFVTFAWRMALSMLRASVPRRSCRTAEAREDSQVQFLARLCSTPSTVVSAFRMWLGNELNFVDPVLCGSTVGRLCPLFQLRYSSYCRSQSLGWKYHRLWGFCVALPSGWSFTLDGTYDSVWDCVMPMIGRYTILYFLYHGDVEYVCLLNDWIASSTKFALTFTTLPSSG